MFYQSGDAQLFYDVVGEGPAVVLLHPTPADHGFWLPMASTLVGYKLIMPDLRGHGRSQAGTSPIDMRALAEDVLRLLDKLEIAKATFVGCSIGGYVLYELWRRAPERVAGLAIYCAKPQPDSPQNKAKRRETIAELQTQGTDHFFETMAQSLVGATARRRNPDLVSLVRERMTMETEAAILIQQALADRPDSMPAVKTITVPLLVVAGGEDASSTPAEMEVMTHLAQRIEYHVIADAGHFAALEQPERAGVLLGEFLHRTLD